MKISAKVEDRAFRITEVVLMVLGFWLFCFMAFTTFCNALQGDVKSQMVVALFPAIWLAWWADKKEKPNENP